RDGAPSGGRRVGAQHRPGGEPLLRLIGADVHEHLAADTVRPDDLPDDEQHQYVSMISTRTPRPPIDVTTWRSALAVRPPRPITVPRSSGCTRTSRRLPRRESTIRTRTSSGWSTIPLTRCS